MGLTRRGDWSAFYHATAKQTIACIALARRLAPG
jgi:hypothetical protein